MDEIEKVFDPQLEGKKDEKDFTFDAYLDYLAKIKKQYSFIWYDQVDLDTPSVLWRHDVDFSVHSAYETAKIENKMGIQATYFFMLGSWFYDVRDSEILDLIKKIKKLGHIIGLHHDAEYLEKGPIDSFNKFINSLQKQKNELESILGVELEVASFHNPTLLSENVFNEMNKKDVVMGMINVYSDKIKRKFKYCSDSNGFCRFDKLDNLINSDIYPHLQVLTHPRWWSERYLTPRQKIEACLLDRAKRILKRHDDWLLKEGRHNF